MLSNIKVNGTQYYPYQVGSLVILASLTSMSKETRVKIQASDFNHQILSVLEKFGYHSIACKAILDLIFKNFINPDFASYIISSMAKLLANNLTSDSNYNIRSMAWQIISKLKNTDKLDSVLQARLKSFSTRTIEKAMGFYKKSDEQYGGDLPPPVVPGTETGSTLTLPQIMQYLQQYMANGPQ